MTITVIWDLAYQDPFIAAGILAEPPYPFQTEDVVLLTVPSASLASVVNQSTHSFDRNLRQRQFVQVVKNADNNELQS